MVRSHDEQMLALLYNLLTTEESDTLREELERSEEAQNAFLQAQQMQDFFESWEDVAAPEHLLEKTLAQIEENEKMTPSTLSKDLSDNNLSLETFSNAPTPPSSVNFPVSSSQFQLLTEEG